MGGDPASAIVGMPFIAVDKAKQVMIIKRGKSVGFAGNDNSSAITKTRTCCSDMPKI